MKTFKLIITLCIMAFGVAEATAADYRKEITVAADGSGDCRTIGQALEYIRAYMDYRVTVYIKNGEYHEKLVIPSWLENVDFIGEDVDKTIISCNDYAKLNDMGTFRTYTVRVDGCHLTFRNLTIRNNAGRVGQAVALHTEGTDLTFVNCRFLGDQDTLFLAGHDSELKFEDCYVEGTTDFIFGPATAWFDRCEIRSKANSYITAASTPQNVEVGFVFRNCRLTADEGVTKVYLGRPWRPYAATAFIDCEMGAHITPAGWDNWRNPDNEKTARYSEKGSKGPGASGKRVDWAK